MSQWPTGISFREYVLPGDTIAWSHGGAEPLSLMAQLLEQRREYGGNVTVFLGGVSFSDVLRPEHADVIRFVSIGGLGTHKALSRAGKLDVFPCRYSDLGNLIERGRPRIDVALVSGSPPDADGNISLGATVAVTPNILSTARVAILEINPNMPFVLGDTIVPLERFDAVVWSDRALAQAPSTGNLSPEAMEICRHIAPLIEDGTTLQIGIGSIGGTLPSVLATRKDIGIHSAILTDQLVDLIECGAANGKSKEVDAGIAVGGELLGSDRLYRFADRNPSVCLRSSTYVLSEEILGRFKRLVSVNGAMEVDLTGQVNAETLKGIHVGAIGGQVDFVRAAARSRDGVSIIAIPSTASDGRSRIVGRLADGVVTTARSEVEFVVTEYGAADLRGRTVQERARALAAIAHPSHREALRAVKVQC